MHKAYSLFAFLILLYSCSDKEQSAPKYKESLPFSKNFAETEQRKLFDLSKAAIADTAHFLNVAALRSDILFEISYATENNFTGKVIYDCPACFMQKNAAKALAHTQELAQKKGLGLKIFDCYRPQEYQYRLWEAFPNINYVAPPEKKSMHSFGCAVDLTLVDSLGKELDMGTPFDSFSKLSYTFNEEIDSVAKENRALLIEIMEAAGFRPIKTEWWHFSWLNCNKQIDNNVKWICQ
jgi:zinc D-Ala-D-Ala dipeptidase